MFECQVSLGFDYRETKERVCFDRSDEGIRPVH